MSVRWVPIGDVLRRRTNTVRVDPDTEYAMVGILNRGRGLFSRGAIRGSQTKYASLSPLKCGDLVFSKLFAWEGSVTIADRDGWVSSEFPSYQIDTTLIDPRFLAHAVGWSNFVQQLASSTSGLGQRRQRVNPDRFEAAKIPLPDIDIQRAIAARLDRVRDVSQQMGAAPGPVTDIERSVWSGIEISRYVKMRELVGDVERPVNVDPQQTYQMLGVKWYGGGVFVRERKLGEEIQAKRVFEVFQGDLIYNRLFAWKGSFATAGGWQGRAFVSNEFPTFVVNSARVLPLFVDGWLRSPTVIRTVGEQSSGSTPTSRNRFKVERFLDLDVPLVDISCQQAVVSAIEGARRLVALTRVRTDLAASLLPAARNEEFRKLLAD